MLSVKNNVESVQNYLNNLKQAVNSKNVYQKANDFYSLLAKKSTVATANQYAQDFLNSLILVKVQTLLHGVYSFIHYPVLQTEYHFSKTDVNILRNQAKMLKHELSLGHTLAVCSLHSKNKHLNVCDVSPLTTKNFKTIIQWTQKGLTFAQTHDLLTTNE